MVVAVPPRLVGLGAFARLKLRILGNGFRGQGWRVALFALGVLAGLSYAGTLFLIFVSTLAADELARLVPAFAGTALVLGWLFVPLVWAGVDETLDPARFALLPLSRRRLVGGLIVAALLGVPAAATLLGTTGLVVAAGVRGGVLGAGTQLVGIVLALLLCVAVSRAVTSAFANVLRARRTRDLAAVVLALLVASLGPLQLGLLVAAQQARYEQVARVAEVLGWTPLAAPYVVGTDVADGRPWAVPIRLGIAALSIGLLLWWWSATVESAMVGGVSSGSIRASRGRSAGPVAGLYPRLLRGLPRTQFGAIVVREVRYWWRDARRRASLITLAVVGVFVPIMVNVGSSGFTVGPRSEPPPALAGLAMLGIGALAAVNLANQFGFDGTAYAAHLAVGVRGRVELTARLVGFSVIMVPLLLVVAGVFVGVVASPAQLPLLLGALLAAYGTGLAVNALVSVLAAYALPETSNPFAMNTGAGVAKSVLAFVGLAAGLVLTLPVALAMALIGSSWSWLVLPAGVLYGLAAAALGAYIGGDVLDRRAPELLAAVTPRR